MTDKFIQERLKHEHSEKIMFDKLLLLEQQNIAVVAQNKSLQGELALYKRMVRNMAIFITPSQSKCVNTFTNFKIQALQELEAENGLH